MAQILEAIMMVLFGLAWPPSMIKAYRCRTARGTSFFFLLSVAVGYICGIAAKIVDGDLSYVTFFYIANLLMVFVILALYFRNRRLDKVEAGACRG